MHPALGLCTITVFFIDTGIKPAVAAGPPVGSMVCEKVPGGLAHSYLFPILILTHMPLQRFLDVNAIFILIV